MIELTTYDINGLTFYVREGTSDVLVVNEVVRADEYRLYGLGLQGVAVDIGANIGVFSVMAAYFGASHVYAYEPEEDNLRVAQANIDLHGFGDIITLIPRAVYSHDRGVLIAPMEGSTAVESDGTVPVQSVTLNSVLEALDPIDYLKIDIEGAEVPMLLAANPELLKHSRRLGMEYHGQVPEWGDMVRVLSGVFDLEVIGHPFPGAHSGGMMYGVNKDRQG